ncbi:UDP-glucose 4-epimerase GalE [Microlunatus ginsengisoli]|uniref:UDP-glucose 4-epimerase n=1 Tax=Microlunatus ginsengisoli TaxID=363863 RepID=A0ABP6ZB23_9ACTN
MAWLVTGGAGYIGAHVVRAFGTEGIDVVVIDDLSSGHRGFVSPEVPFVEANVVDRAALHGIFGGHQIDGVVHLAGFKYAGVSVQRPLHTYTQNVTGMVSLLEEMADHDVDKIVFSSSAATYGTPDTGIVTEQNPTRPESPYGESKLIGEWLLRDQARATSQNGPGLRHTSLRYFNVVGSGYPDLRDTSPHNLFPLVFEQLVNGKVPYINGDDYPTPDGTCVRDYVHVSDLATSHVAAAKALTAGRELEPVYNLGSGDGLSVRQIMDAVAAVTGIDFTPDIHPRRPGDPAQIVATGELAARDLDWRMRHNVEQMVASAWEARQTVRAED